MRKLHPIFVTHIATSITAVTGLNTRTLMGHTQGTKSTQGGKGIKNL